MGTEQAARYGEAEVKAELANFCSGLRLVGIHVVDQGLNTPQRGTPRESDCGSDLSLPIYPQLPLSLQV